MAGVGGNIVTIDTLLRLVPDSPVTVITHLSQVPSLASAKDSTGYSLLHAAASYNQLVLLRILVNEYHVDVNIMDEEGETPLFAAETLEAARCLVEELGADISIKNEENKSAEDNALEQMEDGGEWHLVADYLERRRLGGGDGAANLANAQTSEPAPTAANGDIGDADIVTPTVDILDAPATPSADVQGAPPLPPNVRINMGTMLEQPLEGEGAPDPEFRRRIEELAAREDFQGEEAQKELQELVSDALNGISSHSERDIRRRTE